MKPLNPGDPRQVGRYRLLASLGEGGMGRVLLGIAPDGRLVAVKQVHPGFAHDQDFRSRFRREVEASRMVSGAYTAAVMDADTEAPIPWLASVYVGGPTLREAVDAAGPLPAEALRYLAVGLASALVEVHRAGLVHRDLKPSNVLLTQDGPRVIDFGIARAAEGGTELTHTGSVIGSPAFMSPEQADGRPLTPASDVFSLGSLLVMAATGQAPFAGTSTPQLLYQVVHAHPDLRAVAPEVRRLAEPCLAKNPAARPTPEQILDFLGAVRPGHAPWPPVVHQLIANRQATVRSVIDAPPPEPTGSAVKRRTKVLLAALVMVLLVGGTITTVLLVDQDESPSAANAPTPPPAAPAPDPLSLAQLRTLDPCRVLGNGPVGGYGRFDERPGTTSFAQCDHHNEAGSGFTIDLGEEIVGSGSDLPPAEVAGLPVTFVKHDETGACQAIVPGADSPKVGISLTADRIDDPCRAAREVLGEAVTRIRAGAPQRPDEAGSFLRVDPCALVSPEEAKSILGVAEVTPTGLRECKWSGTGLLSVRLLNTMPVDENTYGDRRVELNGTGAEQEKKVDGTSASCELEWQHRPIDDRSAEGVAIFLTASGSPNPDALCQQAQRFANSLLTKLPQS